MANFEGSFANIPRRVGTARRAVVDSAREWFAEPQLAEIESAVGEVLARSALTGYRRGSLVNVWASRSGPTFVIEVSNAVEVLAPRDFDSIDAADGEAYGCSLRIIHHLMDNVEYSDDGRCVRLMKFLP